jgi:hypothetical protein
MNRTTLAAAIATMAVAVPAGWHLLGADIQSDGAKVRPRQQAMQIGDTTVTLDLDRGVMAAGDRVSATLVATSAHPHKLKISLSASEDMGFGPERVEQPPSLIERRSVVLDAEPGGGPPVVQTFRLDHASKTKARYAWFYIDASGGQGTDAMSAGVATWTGNSFDAAIEPPGTIPDEGPFSIAVRIKNTTKHAIAPHVDLGSELRGVTGLESSLWLGNNDDYKVEPIDADHADYEVAPGAEQLILYRVTPARAGVRHFAFVANVLDSETESEGAMAVAAFDRPEVREALR